MNIPFPPPRFLSIVALLVLFTLTACARAEIPKTVSTPTKRSLEEELAEEERAAEYIATKRAEKTQVASRVPPYVRVSNGEGSYLAFRFSWGDEHVLLPINEFYAPDLDLVTCQLDSGSEISPGILISGVNVSKNECVPDNGALENAVPVIKIPGYFNEGLNTEEINVIDLNGEYAENLADVLTFVIKNDLLGSGDLTVSLYPTDGPNGDYNDDPDSALTYTLPADTLQVSFTEEQMANFEYAEDPVYALEKKFTWKIPPGYETLNLSAGNENWFVLVFSENGSVPTNVYIHIKGVGAPKKD
jgi:hypothetical protein